MFVKVNIAQHRGWISSTEKAEKFSRCEKLKKLKYKHKSGDILTLSKANNTSDNQHDYCRHLANSEYDLHPRGPLHTRTIHKQNHRCNEKKYKFKSTQIEAGIL